MIVFYLIKYSFNYDFFLSSICLKAPFYIKKNQILLIFNSWINLIFYIHYQVTKEVE